jgi:hypothetical protein
MATMSEYVELQADVERLRKIEAAALRVASSRHDGVVTDVGVLDLLDAALEGRADEICDACDKPGEPCRNQHGICSRVGGCAHETPARCPKCREELIDGHHQPDPEPFL